MLDVSKIGTFSPADIIMLGQLDKFFIKIYSFNEDLIQHENSRGIL